jgi:hypothetical protein
MQVPRQPRPAVGHVVLRRRHQTAPPAPPSTASTATGTHQASPSPEESWPGSSAAGPACGSATAAAPEAVETGAGGLALAERPGEVGAAASVGDGVVALGEDDLDGVGVTFAFLVTLLLGGAGALLVNGAVGNALALDPADARVAGATPGGSAAPPSCHEKATAPPSGILRLETPRLEYVQLVAPGFAQYNPQ